MLTLNHGMILCAGFINIFLLRMVSLQSLNERTAQHTACYGNGYQSFIDANCSSTENIYPIQLKAGAKPSTTGCPSEMEWNSTDVLVQQCCVPATNQDCIAPVNTYVPDRASDYLETCVGRTECLKRPAFRMDVKTIPSCNSTVYPSQTHYLYLDYYCVPESKIGRFPFVNLTNDGDGSILYLQGSMYPWETAVTSMKCSVETDCFENIAIYGLHVNFQLDNVTCNQAIVMNDNSGTLYTISCTDNDASSEYKLRTLATSNDNYMEVYYTSLVSDQGLFWLAFKVSGNLAIDCPRKDPINNCDFARETTTIPTKVIIAVISTFASVNLIVSVIIIIVFKCKERDTSTPREHRPSGDVPTLELQDQAGEGLFAKFPAKNVMPMASHLPPLRVTCESSESND